MIPSRGKRMTTCNHTRKKRELPHLVGRQIVSAAGAAAAGRSSAETETVRFYVPSGNGELYCITWAAPDALFMLSSQLSSMLQGAWAQNGAPEDWTSRNPSYFMMILKFLIWLGSSGFSFLACAARNNAV